MENISFILKCKFKGGFNSDCSSVFCPHFKNDLKFWKKDWRSSSNAIFGLLLVTEKFSELLMSWSFLRKTRFRLIENGSCSDFPLALSMFWNKARCIFTASLVGSLVSAIMFKNLENKWKAQTFSYLKLLYLLIMMNRWWIKWTPTMNWPWKEMSIILIERKLWSYHRKRNSWIKKGQCMIRLWWGSNHRKPFGRHMEREI